MNASLLATRATRTLPEGYTQVGKLNLITDKHLLVVMNLVGLVLFLGFGWLFTWVSVKLRPDVAGVFSTISISRWEGILWFIAGLVGITVVVAIFHEAAHGLFFWIFTGDRPVFSFRFFYASASAPGWYLPRGRYIVVGLAPIVLLTILAVALLPVVPVQGVVPITAFIIFNASGAVGDLLVVAWVLTKSPACMVLDEATSITLFLPENNRK